MLAGNNTFSPFPGYSCCWPNSPSKGLGHQLLARGVLQNFCQLYLAACTTTQYFIVDCSDARLLLSHKAVIQDTVQLMQVREQWLGGCLFHCRQPAM